MVLNGCGPETTDEEDELTFVVVDGRRVGSGISGVHISREQYLPLTHKAFLAWKGTARSQTSVDKPKQGLQGEGLSVKDPSMASKAAETKPLSVVLAEAMEEQERQGLRRKFDKDKPEFKRWGRGLGSLTS
jgi:hypothetical protein